MTNGCLRTVTGAVAALLLSCGWSQGALAQPASDERAEVLAVVQRMLDGMRTRDSAMMHGAFLAGAKLLGMRPASGDGSRVQELTAEDFVAFMARDPRPDWTERLWDPQVRIAGTLASVWSAYDFHFGTTFSHCGIDAIHLLRTNDGWRIVSIADTYQTAECPARPAPERQ